MIIDYDNDDGGNGMAGTTAASCRFGTHSVRDSVMMVQDTILQNQERIRYAGSVVLRLPVKLEQDDTVTFQNVLQYYLVHPTRMQVMGNASTALLFCTTPYRISLAFFTCKRVDKVWCFKRCNLVPGMADHDTGTYFPPKAEREGTRDIVMPHWPLSVRNRKKNVK